jgi:acetoacetate decarboxylase
VLKGYSVPLSPLGQANLAPTPPWHYSSDVLAAEFWVNREAAQATLPPNVTIDGDGAARAVIMYLDWQFTASNDEMLDPARYQYRETFILLDAHWRDMAIAYCPYIYVDNDAAFHRGHVQGFPKKLGSVFQTRSFAAPSPAAAPVAAGSKFGASLSAHGERLADIRVTLREQIADPSTVFNRPTVMRRYFPRLDGKAYGTPAVDQLTLSLTDNLHVVDLWAGEAEVRLPEVRGEELHALTPIRTGRGFRFGMSYTVTDLKILEDYAI